MTNHLFVRLKSLSESISLKQKHTNTQRILHCTAKIMLDLIKNSHTNYLQSLVEILAMQINL